jgi:hypothetical protein
MDRVRRNLSTPESREFWKRADEAAAEVSGWPDWKRAGINVVDTLPLEKNSDDECLSRFHKMLEAVRRALKEKPQVLKEGAHALIRLGLYRKR